MFSQTRYLENIESYRPSEVKLEIDDGPVSVPHLDDLVAVLPVDHPVLGQLQGVVHAERRVAPHVLHLIIIRKKNNNLHYSYSYLVTRESKASYLQGTGLKANSIVFILAINGTLINGTKYNSQWTFSILLPVCPGETS